MDYSLMLWSETDMELQEEKHGDYAYSLHSLWRASGEPTDRSPEAFLEQAPTLFEGYAEYMAKLNDYMGYDFNGVWPLADQFDGEGGRERECDEYRQEGDTLAVKHIAELYARFLDLSRIVLDHDEIQEDEELES